MNTVSIIGAGRLGTTLAHALSKKGYRIQALSCRSLASARESRRIIGDGQPLTDNIQAVRDSQLVVLSVPDDMIENVAKELASATLDWSNTFVFHCSGLVSSRALDLLRLKGALTASIHPVQSFAQKTADPHAFQELYFGIDAQNESIPICKEIVGKLGGHYFILKEKDKPLYHAALSIASNLFIALIESAASLLQQTGISDEQATEILFPLLQKTLQNVKTLNIPTSLTGPIVRGDKNSVKKHLEALRDYPSQEKIYQDLAASALEVTRKEKKLSPQKIKALEALLAKK